MTPRDVVQPSVFVTAALKKKIRNLAFTWSRVGPSESLPPVYNPAKHKICASHWQITRNVGPHSWFKDHDGFWLSVLQVRTVAYYTKCRSMLLIQISWLILAFCLCITGTVTLFFLLYFVERILLLTLVVALRSSLPSIARYWGPGDCMKISLSLFSIFPLP